MPRPRKDGVSTRTRLLEAACSLFAQRGFRDTTIVQICKRAHANVAAVNYHFHTKEALYEVAMRHAFHVASARYPIDGGLGLDAQAEQRLRAHITAHLRRTFSNDETSNFPRIIVKEMAEPTPGLGSTLRDVLQPHREHMRGLLRQLLGTEASDEQVRLCVLSIISQCYFFGFNKALRDRHFGAGQMTEERLEALIDHITRFCLAGIRDTRAGRAAQQDAERLSE